MPGPGLSPSLEASPRLRGAGGAACRRRKHPEQRATSQLRPSASSVRVLKDGSTCPARAARVIPGDSVGPRGTCPCQIRPIRPNHEQINIVLSH